VKTNGDVELSARGRRIGEAWPRPAKAKTISVKAIVLANVSSIKGEEF
jgi:hypothetical protein